MRTIALEEHFLTHGVVKAITSGGNGAPMPFQQLQTKLLDLGAGRIAAMDEAGIDHQVLSLATNGLDALDALTAEALLRDVNDELASAVAAYPDRLSGFATLPLLTPDRAAKELERCVSKLGFKGAMLDGTVRGEFLDNSKFLPIFEAAESLQVPIYLHPAQPPEVVKEAYFSGLPGNAGFMLSIAGWGWHAETGLHVLRLIVSGLFEKFSKLHLIIGHMGEGIPYALARSSGALSSVMTDLPSSVAEYFNRNVHITTSGYFTMPPLRCAIEVAGIDRLMFSVDYPFSPNTKGREYIESMDLSQEELEKLTHLNAERLLNL